MPAIQSGYKLFLKLRDSGTGATKLAHILKAFETDRKGRVTKEVPADELVDYINESPDEVIPAVTKLKAESFHLYGDYTPAPPPKSDGDFQEIEATFDPLPDGEPEDAPAKPKAAKPTPFERAKPSRRKSRLAAD